jgi:hypothetical protein
VNLRTTDPTPPPTWVDEFSEAMTSPDRRWSDTDALDPVAAASDMDAWLHDPRPYKGIHQQGWTSAVDDLHTAAGLIGPRLQSALGGDLTTALSATAGLPASDPTPARPAAQTALAALRARWTDPAVLEAAWRDVADACRDPNTPIETVAARRDLFWQLVRAADRNTQDLGRLLAGVLDDKALMVGMARVRLGDIPNPGPGAWPRPHQPAGLAEPERVSLCRRLLATPPTPAHHVVWVAFDRASLASNAQTVGPISFYRGAWVRATFEHDSPDRNQLPAELTSADSPLRPPDLPEGDRVVLARVDLGTGIFPDAPRVAAEQAQAVVTVASVQAGDRYWRPLEGYIHATDGRVTAWSSFGQPFHRADMAPDLGSRRAGRQASAVGSRRASAATSLQGRGRRCCRASAQPGKPVIDRRRADLAIRSVRRTSMRVGHHREGARHRRVTPVRAGSSGWCASPAAAADQPASGVPGGGWARQPPARQRPSASRATSAATSRCT